MKKILLLIITGILCPWASYSQTIQVNDNTSLQPISNVTIRTNNLILFAQTNSKGQAEIGSLKGADSIWLIHVGYHPVVFSYQNLAVLNFKVFLSEKSVTLNEVVVSANRVEEKAQDVTQPVMILKSKDLAFMNQQNTGDVLQNSGNVFLQKSQLGGGSAVIRGFETNKVLMVVDGVRMNNAIYRGGHIQNVITIDNTMLDKVEIVFGPGSVINGSDALGGVMHFYSKNPLLSDNSKLLIKTNAFTRYSSANSEKTGHADFSIGGKKFASLTSITYSDFGDLRQGNNRNPFYGDWGKRTFYVERINGLDSMIVNNDTNLQKQSGYTQYDILQKFLYKQSEKVSHLLNFQYSNSSDIPRYDRLTTTSKGQPSNAQWYYGPQKRLFASYSLMLKNKNSLYDNARVILGFQNIEESRNDRKFRNNNLNHRIEQLDIVTLNADFEKKIKKNTIRYGLDGWFNKVTSTASKENIVTGTSDPLDTRYPDGGSTMQSIATYVSHSLEISKKLVLNDGLRVNNVKLDSKFNNKTFFPFPFHEVHQNNTALNGNLGLVFMPGKDWRFTLSGSSGFRAPNVDDLSKVFESVPGSVVVPNPNLKPEYTYNVDLGISKSFNKKAVIGINGFYTLYKNAISTRAGKFNGQDSIIYSEKMSRVTMSVNAAEAFIYGLNAFLTADITDNFSILSTLNYTYGRVKTDTTNYPLDHISPVFGKTSFILRMKKFKGEFFVMYNLAKKSEDYNLLGEDNQAYSANPVIGYTPAWMTLNVRTAYQFTKNIQLQVAVENILDQNYRAFASNISAPGRNLVFTIRGTF